MSIKEIIQQAHQDELFAATVVATLSPNGESEYFSMGRHTMDCCSPEVQKDHLFDCASLTKTIPTATLALLAIQEGRVQPDHIVANELTELATTKRRGVQLWHLLTHTLDYSFSLAQHRDDTPEQILEVLLNRKFKQLPGTLHCYCNATSIILGMWLEKLYQKTLPELANEKVFQPLQMSRTTFSPLDNFEPFDIVPTEECSWRKKLIHGEVHDESAWTLQKQMYPGSAGIFSSAQDMTLFLKEVQDSFLGKGKILNQDTVQMMSRNWIPFLETETALGWERNQERFMGSKHSGNTIGKTGFTGCSLAYDIDQKKGLVILSNFVHPQRKPVERINKFRSALADEFFG